VAPLINRSIADNVAITLYQLNLYLIPADRQMKEAVPGKVSPIVCIGELLGDDSTTTPCDEACRGSLIPAVRFHETLNVM
jgi:hypothetical protein